GADQRLQRRPGNQHHASGAALLQGQPTDPDHPPDLSHDQPGLSPGQGSLRRLRVSDPGYRPANHQGASESYGAVDLDRVDRHGVRNGDGSGAECGTDTGSSSGKG